jgi:hypothetical protein
MRDARAQRALYIEILLQPIYDTHGSKFEDGSGNEYEDEGAAVSCRSRFGALISDGAMIGKVGWSCAFDRKL